MNVIRIVVAGVVAGAAAWAVVPAHAQSKKAPAKEVIEPAAIAKPDQADLDRSQIIGNRELPKVLYIVPWKKPLQGDLSGRPPGGVLDEAQHDGRALGMLQIDGDGRAAPVVHGIARVGRPVRRRRP